MSAQLSFNDDDLALYAMRLLSSAEADAVQKHLASDASAQVRLATIEVALGLFAEETVPMHDAPAGSLDRLLHSAANSPRTVAKLPFPATPRETPRRWSLFDLLPWAGWAVAIASVLLTVGLYLPRQSRLAGELASAKAEIRQTTATTQDAETENRLLKSALQQKTEETMVHQAKASDVERQAVALRTKADAALTAAATQEAKASNLASVADEARRERDALQGQLNAQTAENSQAATRSADAEQVLSALRDPAALRVTLTVPKKKPSPTGRGTYQASTGSLIFIGNNLPSLKSNKVYELWLMPSDGSAPLPAGTFVPDAAGNATVVTPKFRQNIAAKGFAVTVENQGGSATPTLPIVLAGA